MKSPTDRTILPQVLACLGRWLTGLRRAVPETVGAAESPLSVADINARPARPGVNRVYA
jgi:hypothetical protein